MTLHAVSAYIQYRWQAKTRHGVHSPFVFDFIEQVLHNKAHLPGSLQERIGSYYKIIPIHLNIVTAQQDLEKLLPTLQNDSIVIVHDIHANTNSEQVWQHLSAHLKVSMSIDVYAMGLLLYKEEFKVKQHFVLK